MRKRKAAAVLSALILLIALGGCASAYGNSLEYKLVEGNAVITCLKDLTTVHEIVVPDEINGHPVTSIADFGLSNSENTEKITIGKNVKEIGEWAISNNNNLSRIEVSAENPYFKSVDGVLYTGDGAELVLCPRLSAARIEIGRDGDGNTKYRYTVCEGTRLICPHAFYHNTGCDEIVLPDSVREIGKMAFFKASNLKEITFGEGLEHIGEDAFGFCTGLTQLTLPAAIRQIDKNAFFDCHNLTELRIEAVRGEVTLDEKWEPSNNGRAIDGIEKIVLWANG